MASLTRKKIRGHTYYYARECKRVDGKPKIVWQKYLGKLEDIIAAVSNKQEARSVPHPLTEGLVTELGAVAAMYDLASRLDLVGTIDRHVPKRGKGPSVGTYLLVATINRCIDPRSKAGVGDWFDGTVLRRLLDIDKRQLTSQRFWDNMDRISERAIDDIEEELIARVVKEFDIDLSHLIFDGTNFFTFIDSFNERSSLAQRGKSKEGRASLRIVGLALLVTADSNVPLLHHTYPGNQPDAKTFASLTGKLVSRCKRLVDGVEHVTIVFDKGNNADYNLAAVDATPYHFVGSLTPTHHRDLLAVPRQEFRSLADDGLPGVWAYRTHKKVFDRKRTLVVTFNESLFIAQSKTLLREIGKRQQRFREIVEQMRKWRKRPWPPGLSPPKVATTRKKVEGLLKAKHMKELFVATVSERDAVPVLTYRFKHKAWAELQDRLLGKSILFTDNDQWSDAQIVHAYRAQYHVEGAFREMKDPHHIALRPQYHWTDQKIRVHVFTCVLALTLMSLLRRELAMKNIDLSMKQLMEHLCGIREMMMVFPPDSERGAPVVRTSISSMSKTQRDLFDALDLQRFARG
ncbi:MAG: IS1634 family transposase [Deltaproteobacteria bacterium]|nr:IS1634 family transposase [Deltaproteobacteria bacterium]